MIEYVLVGLGLALLIGLYMWSYTLNEKCERPEGAELTECKSCHAHNCSARKYEIKK